VVSHGGYLKRIDRRDHECRPGTLTVEPPGVSHMERYGSVPVRVLLIEVLPWRAARLAEHGWMFSGPVCGEHDGAILLGRRLSLELRELDGASELALEGLGLELFAIAHRLRVRPRSSAPAGARWLTMVKDRLCADFRSHITLGELAASAGVHPAHLARVFRASQGCSIGDFVRRQRIAWTAERLTTTNDTIASIASSVGFYDQSHFTRVFTRQMGLSPARYRAQTRRDTP
jgi:AraC family transcriptional regulator